jgi:2-polyprenyl-3-methyl-5-hydroxy-6-metoxy-1,4-benzoquinol methylase
VIAATIARVRWQARLTRARRELRSGVSRILHPSRRPRGSARASMFFDAYPRFYETAEAGPGRGRLNLRYEAIIGENDDIFPGARVLDLACHDGRWSLAALRAGAAEVVGIEAREDLVASARENLQHYCGQDGSYRFVSGDVFDVLARESFEADVVLCLGFLYHTLRYNELMRRIRDLNPRYLIVDTAVIRGETRPHVDLRLERDLRARDAVPDPYSFNRRTIVGRPSLSALALLLDTYDFAIERLSDWPAILRDNPDVARVDQYARGERVTARCFSTL